MSAQAKSALEVEPISLDASQPRWRAAASRWLDREGLIVVVVAAYAITSLVRSNDQLFSDGWLALLAGREIVQHGLPSHDTLALWTQGRRWVDEQWLGQLALYGLSRLGGIRLALLTHVGLSVTAFAGGAVLARKRDASPRAVTWIALVALLPYYMSSSVMRTQSFAYPLFVAVLWLLASDSRAPSRRVFLVLPLLILWANLHGSVVLAAGLVALAGVAGALAKARVASPRSWLPRSAALALLPWPCLFVSPYALQLPHYYREVLFNPGFGHYVSEWTPTTLSLVTIPFFLLAAASLWTLGRAGDRFTLFERIALLALLALSFLAIRNVVWFVLASLTLVPPGLTAVLGERGSAATKRLNVLLGGSAVAGTALILVLAAAHRDSWFRSAYPTLAADKIAAAAGERGHLFANEAFADWLMWEHPTLEGRVAWDTRFELLTEAQVTQIADFRSRVGDWRQIAQGYAVFALDPADERKQGQALLAEPGARLLFENKQIIAIAVPT